MHKLLEEITAGKATAQDVLVLEELCDLVMNTSLCGLGQSAPNPVLSTLRYFRNEYDAHVNEGKCPSGVCKIHKEVEA
jgi:NADH:ubiquinone oxidoreductase subunit F (NADH-binding)